MVLPQNPNTVADQQEWTYFQVQVLKGYEQDRNWLTSCRAMKSLAACGMRARFGQFKHSESSWHKLHTCPYTAQVSVAKAH